MNVGEPSGRQRLMLFAFGHVECRARRRVVKGKVVTDREESRNGENLVDLFLQSCCVPLVPQFVNGLHGKDTVKRTLDVAGPVLGFEACEHESGCRESHKTFPAQFEHVLREVQQGVAFYAWASI